MVGTNMLSLNRAHRLVAASLFGSLITLLCYGLAAAQSSSQPTSPINCQEELKVVKDRLARVTSYLQDWPNLGYYREANAQLALPKKNEARVVFMGDSNTDYWDNPGSGGFFPGKPYINRGIAGQITPQMLVRFRQDVLALQPKVVIILAGTNDIAGNIGPATFTAIENNLATMSELAKAHRIRVVLASLLPVSDYNRAPDGKTLIRTTERPLTRIKALNSWIKQYAADNGHIYLDYFTALADEKDMLKEELSNDGVHPNAKGYAVMAPLAEAAIKKALKRRR
jgi:lysophospholipase L1-like esterase